MLIYAGIGSQDTPPDICELMTKISKSLCNRGYVLRSGNAKGADSAFEEPLTNDQKEIFKAYDATPWAIDMASKFHPAWNRVDTEFKRKLLGRNSMIILGKELNDPVKFVVCWTKNGELKGGTALGMRIAKAHNIPIFNLYFENALEELKRYIKNDIKNV